MSYRPEDAARPPQAEPEILPPQPEGRRPGEPEIWISSHRMVFTPPGPLALILGLLGVSVLAALGLAIFVGLFLFWLPIAGALLLGLFLSALLRGPR